MSSPIPMPDSDQDNADLLVANHSNDIRYCTDSQTWFAWKDNRWVIDHEGSIVSNYWTAIAKQMPKNIQVQGPNQTSVTKVNTHRKYSLSYKGAQATINAARRDTSIQVVQESFDSNAYELNTPRGIVDLRTGKLKAPNKNALHTKQTLVTPDFKRKPKRWLKFLDDTFQHDQDVIDYVQQLCGLSLIGEVIEQICPFAHGPGGTGKSTFLNTILDVTGDYGKPASASLLMRGQNAHPEEVAKLHGVRIVVMLEFNHDDRFNEAKVKSLTGADKLEARHMYKASFSWHPTHTLFLAGNTRPQISEGGSSFFRRLKRIPFENDANLNSDKFLHKTLVNDEGPAILAWMIEGAKLYLENPNGLVMPAVVALATAEYEKEEDQLGQFLDDMCVVGDEHSVSYKTFREMYVGWCQDYGYQPFGPRKLTEKLTSTKKYGNIRAGKLDRSTRGFFGLGVSTKIRL